MQDCERSARCGMPCSPQPRGGPFILPVPRPRRSMEGRWKVNGRSMEGGVLSNDLLSNCVAFDPVRSPSIPSIPFLRSPSFGPLRSPSRRPSTASSAAATLASPASARPPPPRRAPSPPTRSRPSRPRSSSSRRLPFHHITRHDMTRHDVTLHDITISRPRSSSSRCACNGTLTHRAPSRTQRTTRPHTPRRWVRRGAAVCGPCPTHTRRLARVSVARLSRALVAVVAAGPPATRAAVGSPSSARGGGGGSPPSAVVAAPCRELS